MQPTCPPFQATRLLTLALLAGPGLALQLPDADVSSGDANATAAPRLLAQAPAAARGFGLSTDGERAFGGGADYKVELEPGGFEFTPALGRAVETRRSLSWSLESVSRSGEVLLAADPTVRPELGSDRAVWSRAGGIEERLAFSEEGVELSFLFPERPAGSGDLVVRGLLDTNLPLPAGHAPDGSLRFLEPGAGGLSIGQVFGIDADGASVTGSTRLVDGALELVLPAAFVDAAAYPLLLDPFIGGADIVDSGFDEGDPDLSYDEDSGTYLVVWERSFSLSDIDIRGRRLNSSGAPTGVLLFIENANDVAAFNPAVGNAGPAGAHLVAWQESTNLFGPYDIRCRAVDASSGALGNPNVLNTASASAFGADVSDSTTDNRLLVVWTEQSGGIRGRIPEVLDNLSVSLGIFGGSGVIDISTNSGDVAPAVSKSGSEAASWAVVWQRLVTATTPDNRQIAARIVLFNGAFGSPIREVGFSTRDEETPDVDGDGGRYMVTYRRDESSSSSTGDIVTRPLAWTGTDIEWGSSVIAHGDSNDDEERPVIAYTGNAYVVAWQDRFSNPDWETRAVVVDALDGEPCGEDFGVPSIGFGDETWPAIVSRHKGFGDPDSRVLIGLLKETDPEGDESIQAAIYETDSGTAFDLDGECFGAGDYTATCIRAGETSKHEIRFADPLTSAFLLGSVPSTPFACDACVLYPNVFTGFILTGFTDNDGVDRLEIDIPPGLEGGMLHMQWALVTQSPGCSVFGIDLSNALELTIQ